MIVIVPMGGQGSRFRDKGYTTPKPAIPVTCRRTGQRLPMAVAAMKDIPGIGLPSTRIICIGRAEYGPSGLEAEIRAHFPGACFIHDHVQYGQAFACLLAREHLLSDDEVIVASCDTGLDIDHEAFRLRRMMADAIMISHMDDENISQNPKAHSWADLNPDGWTLRRLAIKSPVSDDFMTGHATTGVFWFRQASAFLASLEETLFATGNPRGWMVDDVLNRCIARAMKVSFLDAVYYGWGTPRDYEHYELTMRYWDDYARSNIWLREQPLHRHSLPERAEQHRAPDAAVGRVAGQRRA